MAFIVDGNECARSGEPRLQKPDLGRMEQAEAAYVAAHGRPLEAALSEAVNAAIAARAADPVLSISEHLENAAVAAAELERARAEAQAIAATADFRELVALGVGCTIEKTEERGITLTQLGAVRSQIQRRCAAEGWAGDFYPPEVPAKETRALAPENVRLYDAAKHVIKPATVERQCSFVELFASAAQLPKWFVSHWWGEPVRPLPASTLPTPSL